MSKRVKWDTEMNSKLLSIVQTEQRVYDGFEKASNILNIPIDAIRNHWYSDSVKRLRGTPIGVDHRHRKVKQVERQTVDDAIENKEEFKKVAIESLTHSSTIHEDIAREQSTYHTMDYNNEVTKEANDIMSDFKDTLDIMVDVMNRMLQSNVSLLNDNYKIKSDHNRMLLDFQDMQQSYNQMLKMLNEARLLALKEDDDTNGLSGLSDLKVNRSHYAMDKNGNLNAI